MHFLALTNLANRTVNDALFEAELNDSLPRKDQQQRSALPVSSTHNYNSLNQTRPNNMDGTDIFMPSSYSTAPGSFLSHFGAEDQLFQRPLLNNLGHNYVPNPRTVQPPPLPPPPPPQQHYQQRDHSFDQSQNRISPPQRTNYPPPSSNPFIEYERSPPQQHHQQQQQQRHEEKHPTHSQDLFFTDHSDDQVEPPSSQQHQQNQRQSDAQDQDSRRQGKGTILLFPFSLSFLCSRLE